ncbi:MAG: chorismate pyruvate-lyase family protein [bacterium]|nr:chorismate pyruvate-lyase family protein [bacterium]
MIQLTADTLTSPSISYNKLSMPQRIILHNGGSLTKLLEVMLGEELNLNKISEELINSKTPITELNIETGQQIMSRKITLYGQHSKTHYIYADSIIATKNLEDDFADALINTNIPIGKIWEMLKIETYKKIIAWGKLPAGNVGLHFNISPLESVLYRTYLVYSQKKPIMQITEKFPEKWFKDSLVARKSSYVA